MKLIAIFGMLLLSMPAYTGGYYNPTIDTYDPVTGLYYKSVESKAGSGFLGSGGRVITNLYIYDPQKKSGKLLFPNQKNFQIIAFAYEEEIIDGVVLFHSAYSAPVKNNKGVANRNPKSKILILTRDVETEKKTFYLSDKDGSNLIKGRTISASVDWHIDVKNSQIRLVSQIDSTISIEFFVVVNNKHYSWYGARV